MALDFQHILLQDFQNISLEEMKTVNLLNRKDTKYLFKASQLKELLIDLAPNYKILSVNNEVIFDYDNTYFDTENYNCFYQHHRGKLNRIKIRTRAYSSIEERFFEIKIKTNKNRTEKLRLAYFESDTNKKETWNGFLQENTLLNFNDFTNKTNIQYKRITLVNKVLNERCTIDFDLKTSINKHEYFFENLCIAELKQDIYSMHSPLAGVMKQNHIYPGNFSKYCFSLLALKPELKHHLFKTKLRQLNKHLYA